MNPKRLITSILAIALLWACANIGNPEGGPFDVTPPRLIKAKPEPRSTGVTAQRLVLEFDEFIKISGQDKIIVSPPQHKPPIITANGRSISVKLLDSLRPNTTYSIYFDDAVVDNNEDNPLEDLDYTFSTGSKVDTMRLGGVVLDAENLEPISGLVIGAYVAGSWQDSLVFKESFPFASKTNKQGRFVVRGLQDTVYRIFALKDDDNDYRYKKDAEGFAFLSTPFKTTKLDSIKTDTIRIDSIVRRDTLYRDSLVTYNHTYYYPNELVLRYFKPQNQRRGLERSTREDSLRIVLDFIQPPKQAPLLRSIDKPTAAYEDLYYPIISGRSVTYWLRDKELIGADSIRFAIEYERTDSLMQISQQRDTLTFMKPRVKEDKKKPKKPNEEQVPENPFKLNFAGATGLMASTPMDSLSLRSNLPIQSLREGQIQLEVSLDSVYKAQPYRLQRDSLDALRYNLLFERQYGAKYRLRVDSGAIQSIYGHTSDSLKYEQSVEAENALGALQIRIEGLDTDRSCIVQLLDKGDKVLLSQALRPAPSTNEAPGSTSVDQGTNAEEKNKPQDPKLPNTSDAPQGLKPTVNNKGTTSRATNKAPQAKTSSEALTNNSTAEEVHSTTSEAKQIKDNQGNKVSTDRIIPQGESTNYPKEENPNKAKPGKAWLVEFKALKPDTYYLRMFVDDNADGQWTSGDYPSRLPEAMYYSPEKYEVKKSFTTSETWKPLALPLNKQKPLDLLKNKPEEKRKREDKNKEYYKRLEDKKRTR